MHLRRCGRQLPRHRGLLQQLGVAHGWSGEPRWDLRGDRRPLDFRHARIGTTSCSRPRYAQQWDTNSPTTARRSSSARACHVDGSPGHARTASAGLQVDHIDLVPSALHRPARTDRGDAQRVHRSGSTRGLVRYIGVSNYSAWRLMQALWTIDRRDLEPIVSIQPEIQLVADGPSELRARARAGLSDLRHRRDSLQPPRRGIADRQVPSWCRGARQHACERERRQARRARRRGDRRH